MAPHLGKYIIGMVALFLCAPCSVSGEPASEALSEPKPASRTLVIAHRGSSGYLPEHTLAAKAMAYA